MTLRDAVSKIAALAVFALAVLAVLAFTSNQVGASAGTDGPTAATASSASISGDPGDHLYPGVHRSFTVTVTNTDTSPARLATISAGSSRTTTDGCPAGTVTSTGLALPQGTAAIAPGATATYTLTATMRSSADDTCQGQHFALPLSATLVPSA